MSLTISRNADTITITGDASIVQVLLACARSDLSSTLQAMKHTQGAKMRDGYLAAYTALEAALRDKPVVSLSPIYAATGVISKAVVAESDEDDDWAELL